MQGLKEDLIKYHDLYQYERTSKLKVSLNYVCKALKRLEVSYKKAFKYLKAKKEECFLKIANIQINQEKKATAINIRIQQWYKKCIVYI